MAKVKIYIFNSLSEAIIIHIKVLHRSQKETVFVIYALIKLSNLFKVQRVLKRDKIFEVFFVKCI